MVVRVSGKASNIRIVDFKVDSKSISVNLTKTATIEIKMYDSDALEFTQSIRAKYVHLANPVLKDGLHFISVRILSDGKVVDWCGDNLNINRAAKVQEIVFDKKYLNKSDSVSGTVKLNSATASDRVVLKAWDTHGRLFGYTSLPAARSVRFKFPVSTSLSCINRVQAILVSKGLTISQKSAEFTIKQDYDPMDFSMIMWMMEIPEDDYLLSRVYMDQLYKSGVDTSYEYFTPRLTDDQLRKEAHMLTMANLRIIPYSWRIFPNSVADNIRTPCLSDPVYRKDTQAGLTRQARILHPFSVDSYSLGDEDILADGESDVCFSPTCLAGFKEYLRNVYGTLAALNAEWESTYTDWEQILPLTTEQARKSGKTAPWLDFRLHMENVYTDYNMYATNIIRSIEPKAKVGAEGYYDTTSWAGYNWPNLLTDNQLCGLYSNPSQKEIVRSFARKDSVTGTWYGTYTGALYEAAVRSHPWDSLFHRQNSAFWYNSCHSVGSGGGSIFTPDFTPIPAYAQTMQEITEIKRGIGKLILSADQVTDGIAILYSQPSLHAASLNPNPVTQKASWEAFILGLEDCRYQYRFVSTKQLTSGGLKGCKVLILPFAQALSKSESKAILAFAQKGGIVVADYPAGVMDEHGKLLPQSSLNDLFDTSNVLTETRSGKGKGIYTGGHTNLSANLLRLLSKNGIKPGVRLTGKDGKSAVSAGTSVFKLGAIKYVCIMPTQGVKQPINCLLGIGMKAYVYNVRSGKYLGFFDKARITLHSARATVMAFSPYKITGMKIDPSGVSVRQGRILNVSMSLNANQKASDHVFHLSVFNPIGKENREYSKNVVASNGRCKASIPFSLNDTRGKWTVRVTDITSGVSDEKSIQID
jgi:beta-galactosidase